MENIRVVDSGYRIKKGEIFIKMGKDIGYEETIKNPDRRYKNIIVDICSDLIAEWAFTISPPDTPVPGIQTLAVGTGDVSWDLQNPPAETTSQTLLESELIRKTFSSKTYVDSGGNPTVSRTNIIDFTTTYLESEAVGPLVEMGLFGGTNATSTNGGTMVNYKTCAVINKPSTSRLIIVWRLTF